ncbi:MAG: DUF423 domain-containing protein [Bacteroidetes bacterium]|jgi:uncharacterized membrane protein YgdD (TMEM256/DUF423 family)|nr:DUF423 domain-containing protein [Bacteroidota bacterium]MCB0603397.1 DUF423 domain-containing protein [Saprospiraceae bacterium]MCO5276803.1 DUF423 domain-containing protein [Saprospiraceae bacterium]
MRFSIITASILGITAVILGAFGAHGLKPVISAESLEAYRTGVSYQFYHTLAILACGILYHISQNKAFLLASKFFLVGIILFSGSIYFLSTRQYTGIEGLGFLGPITPLGGLTFIAGWVIILISSLKLNKG